MPVELNDSGLKAFLAGIEAAIAAGNDAAADMIVDLARQLAPVDEGDFRDSIAKADGEAPTSRRVISDGAKAPHNIFVEYGQPNNTAYPAQPTLGPAAEAIDADLEVAKQLVALAARSRV
jgi:hypothetical protein